MISRRTAASGLSASLAAALSAPALAGGGYGVRRLVDGPIVAPGMDARMGSNIEGPSLIAAPKWLPDRLGAYYLYFADHKGDYIRLAYADRLEGPWTVHAPGSLQFAQSKLPATLVGTAEAEARLKEMAARRDPAAYAGIPTPLEDANLPHVASPDVHVDEAGRRIVMHYHGLAEFGVQRTRAAVSKDGVNFEAVDGPVLGPAYMRLFGHGGWTYAMAMPGQFLRTKDPLTPFEKGPTLFGPDQRHNAVLVRGDTLHIFWTRVGDAPERIYASTLDLRGDWMAWKASEPVEILRAERPWEGADLPAKPSLRSAIGHPVNQIRDPAIFQENGRTYLLYAVKGEHGLGIAELTLPEP
ncbi:hypothetical protein [Phenylobacterium sp.]|uniref:hypothetical protein n=1 Tax=Phenylobacterium sp. TaxID=1871053 RepID=UPI0025D3A364|nr:hypothetical protein [Phenylobacterium sp.]MBX3484030.1 hypothetical protein [Phenylobacterium sp.]